MLVQCTVYLLIVFNVTVMPGISRSLVQASSPRVTDSFLFVFLVPPLQASTNSSNSTLSVRTDSFPSHATPLTSAGTAAQQGEAHPAGNRGRPLQSSPHLLSLQERVAAAAPPTGQPGRQTPLSVTALAAAAVTAPSHVSELAFRSSLSTSAATGAIAATSGSVTSRQATNVAPPAIVPLSFPEDVPVQVAPGLSTSVLTPMPPFQAPTAAVSSAAVAASAAIQAPPLQAITRSPLAAAAILPASSVELPHAPGQPGPQVLGASLPPSARRVLLSSSSLSEESLGPATPSLVPLPLPLHSSSALRVLLFEAEHSVRQRLLRDLPWLLLFLACLAVTAYACIRIGMARYGVQCGNTVHIAI